MKVRRSTRLVDMTIYFIKNPNTTTPLSYFTEKFKAAKSSISEDLAIIKDSFEENDMGSLITYAGARGGVQFQPYYKEAQLEKEILALKDEINGSERLLPGGYIYTSDLLGDPGWLNRIGKMIASKYAPGDVDAILRRILMRLNRVLVRIWRLLKILLKRTIWAVSLLMQGLEVGFSHYPIKIT